ncbi:MAG: hypothetical protein O3A60_07655 [Planctomycetota bacterium]|nr:hypothetical protein [Planctomycetota bacterium]
MSDKIRQRMALEAARLVNEGRDIATARYRAARAVQRGWVPEEDLPSIAEIRQALTAASQPALDRFDRIAEAVGLLASVRSHPMIGSAIDGLEHALAVFAAIHAEHPYDEELLTAALVIHAGLAIDRGNPVQAVLDALGESLTPRTTWFVESMPLAEAHVAGSIGQRARRRLETHPDGEQAILLALASRRAASPDPQQRAMPAGDLGEAIAILRSLDAEEADEDATEIDTCEGTDTRDW